MVGDVPGDFTYRGFMVGLVAHLAHPRGWFGVATIASGDLSEEDEHVIRTPEPFAEAHDAFAAAGELSRAWIDQRA